MNLTIKNVPDAVYQNLKNRAAQRGRSLNAEILDALIDRSEEIERRTRILEARTRLEKIVSSLPISESSVGLIRQGRRELEDRLSPSSEPEN